MITAATLMQRIPPRTLILLALLLAAVTAAVAIASAFHGVPVHGHMAMFLDSPTGAHPNMYFG